MTAVTAALATSMWAQAQSANGLDRRAARVAQAASGQPLAAAAASGGAVAGYLRSRGHSDAVLASLRTDASATRAARGLTHLRVQQEIDGLAVHGAYLKATLNARGELVHVVDKLAEVSTPTPASIDALTAVRTALAALHPGEGAALRTLATQGATTRYDGGAFFHSAPSATAVIAPLAGGTLARAWLVETWSEKTNELNHTLVGGDGRILDVERRTASDSYNIFPIDPGKGPQTVVQGPGAGNAQSPIGWLGAGTQLTTLISGNNVDAYLDANANNNPDKGGTTVTTGAFVTAANLSVAPTTDGNKAVAVQNLFYLNNRIHDILYGYGFDEAAGNFQADNFGQSGRGRDPVQAEAQDGSGTDNANFATPPDGRQPRMQMYLWTGPGATHQVQVTSPVAATYAAMGAAYGPTLTTTGLSGGIVVAVPNDGCAAITTPLAGKIALIDRGTCEFSTKSLNAQKAGAVAAIIADNRVEPIFTLAAGSDAKRVRIPTLMVSQADGAALKALSSPVGTVSKLAVQPLQLDASLDSDVVYHEYCHGLTWRMIGGMSGPLAGAIGEGMSDGCALLINNDDVMGEYAGGNPLGIRRFRYAGYPLKYSNVTGAEVHNDGEIYAAIVWRMKELFDAAYGQQAGTSRLFTYIVDGMNYTPATPAYENMRDGILASITNTTASADDTCRVWSAFAQFEVGVGAQGVA
ncbi:MAG TPA: M36 family metallopeptidase, partial [Burkholderiaceae bacterium]|nr:M36 family metallopeptidase [Burkholderiaceae bacterium]